MKLALTAIVALLSLSWTRIPAPPEGEIGQLRMGTHWMGVETNPKDLIGKVVLLEYWGS